MARPLRYHRGMGGRSAFVIALALAACGNGDDGGDDDDGGPVPCGTPWTQWGGDGSHAGQACAEGQPLREELARVTIDPFVAEELRDSDGVLVVHYQAPLLHGDDVYMMFKGGTYTPCPTDGEDNIDCSLDPFFRESQEWGEKGYRWVDGALRERWSFVSDWKPVPGLRFEQMFQPAIAGDLVALPAAAGGLHLVDRHTGEHVREVRPFGTSRDLDMHVAGGIAAGPDGTFYYNAIRVNRERPWIEDAQGWLIAVAPDGTARTVSLTDVVPLAPDAACYTQFPPETPLPWPPPPNPDGSPALPPTAPCGGQRPGINVVPAIGADGTIFTVTRAHLNQRYVFVTAFRPDLTVAWSTSLRDQLADGCGVTIPANGTETMFPANCREGAILGVDPRTNQPPAGQVIDIASSSPTALPDGGVLFATFSAYNDSRGHLFKLDASGAPAGTYDFGWDVTPAVVRAGAGYEIVIKDNFYREDMWADLGPYYITRLDAALTPLWRYQNTETRSCLRQDNGDILCVEDHPNGFEWCVNALAVDAAGVTYANAEDGHLYALRADGTLRDRYFLDIALGAAYTPLSIDQVGRVYALNNGTMIVVGDTTR